MKKTKINKPQFFIDQGVDFRIETDVVQINSYKNFIALGTNEVIGYDYLIIATGRKPFVSAVVERDKRVGIYTFNEDDAGG